MTHPRDRFRAAPGRITVVPQHPCRRRTDPDPLNDLRDAHNVPRPSLGALPVDVEPHGSGSNDHIGTTPLSGGNGRWPSEDPQSSVAGHAAAEAPDAISLVQPAVTPPQGQSPAVDFSQGGGADPLEAA